MTEPFFRKTAAAGMMFVHPCQICGTENAPFGFEVELRNDKLGRWYCAEHKGQANVGQAKHESGSGRTAPRTVDEAAPLPAMGEARPDDGRTEGPQGKLFD